MALFGTLLVSFLERTEGSTCVAKDGKSLWMILNEGTLTIQNASSISVPFFFLPLLFSFLEALNEVVVKMEKLVGDTKVLF
jgi:hypothetical protein